MPVPDAYRLWAATYDEENVLTALDQLAVDILSPPLAGRRLLDAACGTARRLSFGKKGAPLTAVGVDLVPEMLRPARRDPLRSSRLAAGDVRSLPLSDGTFDLVWCRLAAGHLADLGPLYREFARVSRPGGAVIVTDLHPDAAGRGHVRSFRDPAGVRHAVAHTVHPMDAQEVASGQEGLALDARLELSVGSRVRAFYEAAGALDRYGRDEGQPLLVAYRFRAKGAR
jgi:malonyl-CoA O-methyltransferase